MFIVLGDLDVFDGLINKSLPVDLSPLLLMRNPFYWLFSTARLLLSLYKLFQDSELWNMRIYPLTLALALIASAQQEYGPNFIHFNCGNSIDNAPADLIETHRRLHEQPHVGSLAGRALTRRYSPATIVPTAFHFVLSSAEANSVSAVMPQSQLAELNTAYKPSGFQFKLVNLTRTISDSWASGATAADVQAMQQSLRQGSYGTLNIYFMSDLAYGILGQCSMPTNIGQSPAPSVYASDGCFVQSGSMPNGSIYGYNQGKTAVHETGHWLGLFHPFEGYSCTGAGDFVSDTPQQSTATSGCPTNPPKDSCPYQPGLDAIHNYMDYSTDQCYTNFTTDQILRMQQLWIIYRKGK
jgi:hypothetical protein